jgi:cytosol alanyl aminopeptidase
MQKRLWTGMALAGTLALMACGRDETAPATPQPAATPAPTVAAEAPIPLLQLPRTVVPTHYRLELTILPEGARFTGHAEIDVKFAEPRRAMYMHGRDLHVSSVKVVLADGSTIPARYEQVHKTGVVRLTFDKTVPAGAAKLVFDYDAAYNGALGGLYKVVDRGDSYIFSQFEDIDARRAYPSFDEPGFKTPFDLVITAPAAHQVVVNTLPIKEEALPGGLKRITFATTKPLPTYLLEFAVGPLDVVQGPPVPPSDLRATPLPVRGVTVRGKGEQIRYALAHTPALVTLLEHYFGRPYPFDKLDLIAAADFAAGGMENAAAIVYREPLMLMNESSPLDQRRRYAGVHSHEVSHMWFGDLVTPAWWDDIWLNEAFATWMGHRVEAEWFPQGEYNRLTLIGGLDVMRLDSLASARRIREPINSVDDIDNAFDDITYSKGAAVLAMFENYAGPDPFRDGVRLHMQRYAYGNATTEQFLGSVADGSRHPQIVAAFHTFLDQPNVPLVTVHAHCGAGGNGQVSVKQSTDTPIGVNLPARQWKIPLCMRAVGANGQRSCTILDKPQADLTMPMACSGPLMPNAEGAGYYHFTTDDAGWHALIAAAPKLSAAEQITLLRNLEAGVRAGNTKASLLFEGLREVAPIGSWDALEAAERIMRELHDTVIAPADRAAFEAMARGLIRPRLDAVGLSAKPGEPVANAMIRYSAAWFLTNTAADQQVRAELAKAGEIYMTSGGKSTGALPTDLAQYALWSAVARGGPAFGRRLIAALKASEDQEFRRAAMFALTAASDPQFLREIYALSLSNDLKLNEGLGLIRYLSEDPDRRVAQWVWIEANLDSIEARVTPDRMAGILRRLDSACDVETRDRITRIYRPRLDRYEGAPRQLKQVVESTDRCIAFKNAKAGEIAAAFKS